MKRLSLSMAAVITVGLCSWASAGEPTTDAALARAERFVENSPKYLHHRHLRAGMKGYGLSVFSGTKIERFHVEIVSIVRGFPGMPQQDVILARMSGQGLERTRIVEGMSGSPVYMKDPRDGKDKLIGAVAFGWPLANEPQCGLQPIVQMLAMPGVLPDEKPALDASRGGDPVPPRSQPASQPTTSPSRGRVPVRPHSAPATRATTLPAGHLAPKAFLPIALRPGKGTFPGLASQRRNAGPRGQLRPLSVPVCVSGCDSKMLSSLQMHLRPVGLRPVAAGGLPGGENFGGLDKKQLDAVKLQPGSALAIPLVTGDQDWTAVGTVTDVRGEQVLALGHSMFGAGKIHLPMGTAYIHQIVNTMMSSFKLGSAIRTVGVLHRDEEVGVGGQVGPKVSMIPMTVTVDQAQDTRRQTFRYHLARERFYTPRLAASLVDISAYALRLPPIEHYVRYEVRIDFGTLGTYRAVNVTTGRGVGDVVSDVARPILALLNNPFGPAPRVENIDVKLAIYPGNLRAKVIDLKLNGTVFRPGQKVTGTVLLEPYRRKRLTVPVELTLPADLPEGEYPLAVGDVRFAETQRRREQPQDFSPRTVKELLASLERAVEPKSDRLYLHLPVRREGVALGMQKLPSLPGGKAQTLLQADLPDARTFQASLLREQKVEYIPVGRASATITVRKQINETLLREKR